MPTATVPLPPRAVYTTEPVYRFSVEQWHEMIEQGTLKADDPVELIEGVPVFKMAKNPPHAVTTGLLGDTLLRLLGSGWHIRSQEPVTLTDGEPEPDLVIARGRRVDYAARHPGPSEVGLLVEVADSTLDRDRGPKLRSYARAGVACYWILNLIGRQIEVYTDPDSTATEPRYRRVDSFRPGDVVPLALDGRAVGSVRVNDVLPPG
jgi:hypothetical protein